jgi:Zn-dependent metalloprotease
MKIKNSKIIFLLLIFILMVFFGSQNTNKKVSTGQIDLNKLVNGDYKHVVSPPPNKQLKKFKNLEPSTITAAFTEDDAKQIARKFDNGISLLKKHTLDNEKKTDIKRLESFSESSTKGNLKFDTTGRLRANYNHYTLSELDTDDQGSLNKNITNLVEMHPSLFGLNRDTAITESITTCSNDSCSTKIVKEFHGLPAWDHELKLNIKGNTLYAAIGEFYPPKLPAPRNYIYKKSTLISNLADFFSTEIKSIGDFEKPEFGVAKNGDLDFYAFRIKQILVNNHPYEIYYDAETSNVIKALPLRHESIVNASGTRLDGQTINFSAYYNGTEHLMIDTRFPESYYTTVLKNMFGVTQTVSSNSASSGWPASAVSALDYSKQSIDYFKNNHAYSAVDPRGEYLNIIIDENDENAYWSKATNTMTFGIGEGFIAKSGLSLAAAKDVVGHELTHGVIDASSGLLYEKQSGALNESFADFFGTMIDDANWTIGEDLESPTGKPLRNLADPSNALSPQPMHFDYYVSLPANRENDWGGVHLYSGIPNKALYMLAEGLSENGASNSIGKQKTANLAFKTMIGLTPRADFNDAAEFMTNLSSVEYPNDPGIQDSVIEAWQYVGLPDNETKFDNINGTSGNGPLDSAVIYLDPFLDPTIISPENNFFTINIQIFSNNNPQYNSEKILTNITELFSNFKRPSLWLNKVDGFISIAYQAYNGAYYLYVNDGLSSGEILLDNGDNLSGIAMSDNNENIVFAVKNTNQIILLNLNTDEINFFDIEIPTTSDNSETKTINYIDSMRFDPTGRYLVFDFFQCSVLSSNCDELTNGNWSIAILDIQSGEIEYPFPSQPSYVNIGFPSFSNLTDRYITLDIQGLPRDDTLVSLVSIYDRVTGNLIDAGASSHDSYTTGHPSFSSDDSKLVFNMNIENTQFMAATKLKDYMPDYDNDEITTILNPSFAFKSYIPNLHETESTPVLILPNSLIDVGSVDNETQNEVEFCVENQSIFPIEIYNATLPTGFRWNGFNKTLSPETSLCSPFVANGQLVELNSIDFHFSLSHNGDNSPTQVYVSGNMMNDNDSDGILNNEDPDDDNDGVDDSEDTFPFDASETSDNDQDGIGNNSDNDDDNDGVLDSSDAFPFDPSENADDDQDGIGNNADDDDDNDGVLDSSDAFPFDPSENADNDQDGIGDNADNDDDNDGVLDSLDAFPNDPSESSDADQDGIGDNADLDDNNDGIIDGPTFELEPNDSISQGIVVGQTVIGTMASGSDLDWYSLSVESPGSLTVAFQTELSDYFGFDIEIFDSEFNLLTSKSCATGCVNSADELIAGISEAGTYFVKIKSMSSSSPPDGTYTFSTSFSSNINNHELEPNDSISQGIVVGQTVIGTMASGSDLDWYSLSVESPGSLTVAFQTELSDYFGFDIEIFDSEFNLLTSKSCATGCVNSADELIAGISEAGTYFVKIKSMSSSSPPDGTYTFSTQFASENASVDNSPPTITLNGSISIVMDQFDEYIELGAIAIDDVDGEIQIETNGSVNTNVIGTYTMTYNATDQNGNSSFITRQITVKEKIEYDITSWDFDKNGSADALTDGLMLLRYAFGLRGSSLTNGAIASNSMLTAIEIESSLASSTNSFADIDGNGNVDALTDGLMLLRYLFGLRGESLISGAIGGNSSRTSHDNIEIYINNHMP